MSHSTTHATARRILSLTVAAGAASLVLLPVGASANACDDAVAGALHSAHAITGDPAGVVHEAEETYCSIGG